MFIRKDSDGAACELIGKPSCTLRIPHIPEETDIFWTGFAIVNVEEEVALTTWTFYSDNGTVVGTETLTIPSESKLKGLMTGLFPDEAASARWATISSNRKLAGIEIYGTHDGGICGLVLPGDATTTGILPDVRAQEGEWTGIAITNPMMANAHVSIRLVNAAGVVKANRTETLAPLHRFKTVVADYFEEAVIEDGDTIRFLSDQPVIALEVCGDLNRTFMTALTTGR
ncbi:MAG: hypothetical protein GXO70_07090 [Acidobacteria bacterium]|nr:hypothetical protein [Acidobacteriota bacterium]